MRSKDLVAARGWILHTRKARGSIGPGVLVVGIDSEHPAVFDITLRSPNKLFVDDDEDIA